MGIGERIRAARTAAGLSLRETARRAHLNPGYLSQLEHGARTPSPQVLTAVADVLGTDLAEAPGDGLPAPMPSAGIGLRALSDDELEEMIELLREHWHVLVRTDNMFGPRYAKAAVLDQLTAIERPLRGSRDPLRTRLVSLGAQYAESSAWLHEDAGDMTQAGYWTGRAMEWAHEANDRLMLAWTLFRRSQHAAATGDAQRTVALARAAGRDGAELPAPMRAAVSHQEAIGYALDGNEAAAHQRLDEALRYAVIDTCGDARSGHGSFCNESYIELQRAYCWLLLRRPDRAVAGFDAALPHLPAVYRRDRGVAFGRLARAQLASGEPEQAAASGRAALSIATAAGSQRTRQIVGEVGKQLTRHRRLPVVSTFLDELDATS